MAGRQISDTIAAIATPPGVGGIGIIRISGPDAPAILRAVFTPAIPRDSFASHRLYYGTVQDRDGAVLDEVLAVYMKGPHTYTREDVVELQSHGSYLVLTSILSEIMRLGARPAEPGEFTKRAFLGGRIDLTRAEAVIDLLRAKTDSGLRLAVRQLQGRLQERIEAIRQALVRMLAVLEVAIDFPDDDVELIDRQAMLADLEKQVETPLAELINLADQGRIVREGVSLVIVGLPNVGKSSLLNALLREERALVTEIPGTTRDTIEEMISIRGVPVRIVDTAGIRARAGAIEELGIERARRKMREADLILFLVDASLPLSPEDIGLYESLAGLNHIVVLNKIDLADEAVVAAQEDFFGTVPLVRTAALRHEGLDRLQDVVYERVVGGGGELLQERESCAPNVRHRGVLLEARESCGRLRRALAAGLTMDLIAVEVQAVLGVLGEIVGLTTTEDVLDQIFAEFCIGK